MPAKPKKSTTDGKVVVTTRDFVSHEEAAKRMLARTDEVTTKKEARALLRKIGILNKNNKLVKGLT